MEFSRFDSFVNQFQNHDSFQNHIFYDYYCHWSVQLKSIKYCSYIYSDICMVNDGLFNF